MTFRAQFYHHPTLEKENPWTYPPEKKDAESGDGGQAPHAGGLRQRRGAQRIQGLDTPGQPVVELPAALPDGLVDRALHKKTVEN